jgi:hypothetical protein
MSCGRRARAGLIGSWRAKVANEWRAPPGEPFGVLVDAEPEPFGRVRQLDLFDADPPKAPERVIAEHGEDDPPW